MANIKTLIDKIIDEETPNDNPATAIDERAIITNRKNDLGGRTQWGISEPANPQAWQDGKVTEDEARSIYHRKYIKPFEGVQDERLLAQMVDFGVTSGPGLVAQKVQEILQLEVDGIVGPHTLEAINSADPIRLNNQLALARIKMIGRIVHNRPAQAENINGWINRALSHFIL